MVKSAVADAMPAIDHLMDVEYPPIGINYN
jgi:hypothetical protein